MEKVHRYWMRPDDGLNQPERYRDVSPDRSVYLVDLFTRLGVEKGARVLEIGPNVGRNLAYLEASGYHRLEGVEISSDAITLMRKTYPQLSGVAVVNQPIENVAYLLPTRGYDVAFTMAVFEHIHTEATWIFAEIARAAKMIITIEDEYTDSLRHFPRNYRNTFTELGMEELHHENCKRILGLGKHFEARVFIHA